ncbi:MAG: cupin domain-containing protein [Bacteroidota bacterium]|nr:cupin domain-containing protein [Bacteroidota bacterium]
MKKIFLCFILSFPFLVQGQHQSLGTIKAPKEFDNIYTRTLASDSLSTSFVIFVKKEVRKHKHAFHTENVYVLEGSAEMLLGDKMTSIKKGDMIFIPKNTDHAVKVTSVIPLKIVSVQSPFFDGTDRIFLEQ